MSIQASLCHTSDNTLHCKYSAGQTHSISTLGALLFYGLGSRCAMLPSRFFRHCIGSTAYYSGPLQKNHSFESLARFHWLGMRTMCTFMRLLHSGPRAARCGQNFMLACQRDLNNCLQSSTTARRYSPGVKKIAKESFNSHSVSQSNSVAQCTSVNVF